MSKSPAEAPLTPLFQQYFALVEAWPDCLVLMQCGDFYEAYGEGAETFAREADLILTAKEAGAGRKIPMAGIPLHTVEGYLRTLVAKGYRVAVADQMLNPSECKGLVPREVTRIVTAGTILDPQSLNEKEHNYLVGLYFQRGQAQALAAADISTGHFCGRPLEGQLEQLGEELDRFQAREVVVWGQVDPGSWSYLQRWAARAEVSLLRRELRGQLDYARHKLESYFQLATLEGLGLSPYPGVVVALAGLLDYLQEISFKHQLLLAPPRLVGEREGLLLDQTTRRNLELVETLLGRERKGSLLGAIDRTRTSLGARKLKEWLLRPLTNLEAIERRHQACQDWLEASDLRRQMRGLLGEVVDLERVLARVSYGTFNPRELLGISLSLQHLGALQELLKSLNSRAFTEETAALEEIAPSLEELAQLLERAIDPQAPPTLKEGGVIREGYCQQLDELRSLHRDNKAWLAQLEERERAKTGIKTLKVGYNSIFGYYLEVTKANSKLVPLNYVRKQTLVNSERYIIPELKEYEVQVLGAQEKIRALEQELFQKLKEATSARASELRALAQIVAEVDVLSSLAQLAREREWVRPQMRLEPLVRILKGRHPVVEQTLGDFVPNDCHLEGNKPVIILTGPNMSGKSTWLRQVAQIAILAQMGSFVPAQEATLSIFDRIFTRVGASDDLHLGQSTFMVELRETANIVNNATARSLVILDEIGRGTSTFDGLAIAQAVVEYLHDGPRPLTLFATHFHELTRLGKTLRGCRNFRVAVQELPEEVVFLHHIVPGGADRSYGIYVAKLAGMPQPLLQRAQTLLRRFQKDSKGSEGTAPVQLDMYSPKNGAAQAGEEP